MSDGFAKDLTIVIPDRNELFMSQTIQDVLDHTGPGTEIIAICDGSWPDPPIHDDPRVKVVHTTKPIGQGTGSH